MQLRSKLIGALALLPLFVHGAESFLQEPRPTAYLPRTHQLTAPRAFSAYKPSKVSTVFPSSPVPDQPNLPHHQESRVDVKSLALLATVPVIYGTYNTVVKILYTLNPPVPGLVFSAIYFWVGSATLWTIRGATETPETNPPLESKWLNWRCGAELGSYLFLGVLLQITGLKTVPAARCGFLIQLTTVFVPFLEAVFKGKKLTRTAWSASALALLGVLVIEMEGMAEGFLTASMGDIFMIVASIFYSFHIVRLGDYSKRLRPLQLASSKATAQGIISTCLVATLFWNPNLLHIGAAVKDFVLNPVVTIASAAAILWTGWSMGAWAIFAQSAGQRKVSPVTANMIYTLQPIFTAVFAALALGETIGRSTWMGGALILGGVYLIGREKA